MDYKFLWGVATSAFQLEGSPYADWTTWGEQLRSKPNVTNHYILYKKDLINAYGLPDFCFLPIILFS
jgi:beta-glucosidase/6-phospho-beta-glucosidase/beta-galactosidase